MAVTSLQSESPASNRTPAADLLSLRMNDTTPFPTHGDGLDQALRQARAVMIVLESAFRTAREAQGHLEIDTITCLNPTIVADALDGAAALIALAQHHRDQMGH